MHGGHRTADALYLKNVNKPLRLVKTFSIHVALEQARACFFSAFKSVCARHTKSHRGAIKALQLKEHAG